MTIETDSRRPICLYLFHYERAESEYEEKEDEEKSLFA